MSSKRVKRGGRYKKRGSNKASGRRPAYSVHSQSVGSKAEAKRFIDFAAARTYANKLMDTTLAFAVTITGPSGSAWFSRQRDGIMPVGPWSLDHSLLEELPMPGGEDL